MYFPDPDYLWKPYASSIYFYCKLNSLNQKIPSKFCDLCGVEGEGKLTFTKEADTKSMVYSTM